MSTLEAGCHREGWGLNISACFPQRLVNRSSSRSRRSRLVNNTSNFNFCLNVSLFPDFLPIRTILSETLRHWNGYWNDILLTCWTMSRARGVAWVKTSMWMLRPGSSRIKHPMSNHLETTKGFWIHGFIHLHLLTCTHTLNWSYAFGQFRWDRMDSHLLNDTSRTTVLRSVGDGFV